MPSANPKLEKQASTEAVEPIRQAIIVIEHRIRNLEKRKGRLDSYRTIVKNGGELNSDQKTAVEKYDEVQQSLEITKEMHKQVVSIANDAAKQAKKIARKEAAERMQRDIARVREVLMVQEYLLSMNEKIMREDFLAGTNGAIKLTEEEMKFLDDIHDELSIKHHSESSAPLTQQAQKVAEHLVAIIDGKQREVAGTTYHKIKEILSSITQSGYFDQVTEVEAEAPVEELTEMVQEVHINNVEPEEQVTESYVNDRHMPPSETLLPMPNFPVQTSHSVSNATSASNQMSSISQQSHPNMTPVAQVETSFFSNAVYAPPTQTQQTQSQPQQQPPTQSSPQPPRINDVIGTPNFFFLQDSELDAPESTLNTSQPQVQAVVSHISVAVNAPIPTQTFTNQSFAAVSVPQQVMYQSHAASDMSHITSFPPNPPPPIPMPTSHQPTAMQFTPQHQVYQQEPTQNSTFESMTHHQETNLLMTETKVDVLQEHVGNENDMGQITETTDWVQMNESIGDWSQTDNSQTAQDTQLQNSQQAWGDQQRSGFRGRGGRRGNGSNGYNNRSRGSGGYQSNGGGNPYYRNDNNTNYPQNGYQRNWSSNDGTTTGNVGGGYNSGFKRGGGGGSRGGPRNDRGNMSGGSRGQYRGGQRGANQRNFAPRGKLQAQN